MLVQLDGTSAVLCLLLATTCLAQNSAAVERMRRARNSSPPKTLKDHESLSDAIPSLDLKLGDALEAIERTLAERLTKIDASVSALTSAVEGRVDKIERDVQEMKQKLEKKNAGEEAARANVNAIAEAMSVELVANLDEIYQSVDEIDKKVQQNRNLLAQSIAGLAEIKEFLHANNLNGSFSGATKASRKQERKERAYDHSHQLINDILSMVRSRLGSGDSSYGTNATLPVSIKIDRHRDNGSSTYRQQRVDHNDDDGDDDGKFASQTNGKKNKGGIIFPSVKNKPTKVNNTYAVTDSFRDVKGYSCTELLNAGMRQSDVYYLQIRNTTYWFLKVFCEQEIGDGGWTVIQRRDDFGEPRENFNRDWADYKNGFGDPAKEFWMGNENIYMLTNNEDYALRIELEDFEGNKRYAQYSHFKIHSEADYYKLEIDGYEGNAGDSLNDPWYGSNNSPFSTYNRDNDRSSLNCASMLKGGWWWKSCGRGLNGPSPSLDSLAKGGIIWFQWNGHDYALKSSLMMMKPTSKMN